MVSAHGLGLAESAIFMVSGSLFQLSFAPATAFFQNGDPCAAVSEPFASACGENVLPFAKPCVGGNPLGESLELCPHI